MEPLVIAEEPSKFSFKLLEQTDLKKLLSSELLIYILNLASFASILTYISMCGSVSVFRIRIRIQEAPEYGSNTDPDPQHCSKLDQLCTFRLLGL